MSKRHNAMMIIYHHCITGGIMFRAPSLTPDERKVREAIQDLNDRLAFQVRQENRWTASLRRMTLARNVQGSNSIEGINASVDDVAAIAQGDRPSTVDEDTERALIGYQLAMTYVLELSHDQIEIDATLIRALHYMVTSHEILKRPGRYRTGPVYVLQEATGDIVHEGADAEALPTLMRELTESINQSGDQLIDAAMAHLNFVLIHPFKDGNGRMARVLQSLVLASANNVAPVFLSIEEYLGRHTQAYYDVLAEVGRGEWPQTPVDPEQVRPWLQFTLTAHYNQAMERAYRIDAADKAATALTELLADTGVDERALDALYDALFGATVTRSRYIASVSESGPEISEQTATRDLTALTRAGILIPVGEKRGRAYSASRELLALRSKVGLGRAWRQIDPFASLRNDIPLLPYQLEH